MRNKKGIKTERQNTEETLNRSLFHFHRPCDVADRVMV